MEACGGGLGSSADTRVPEMRVEDPASGTTVVGITSQEPETVREVWEGVSVETVAEMSRTEDISQTWRGKRKRKGGPVFVLSDSEARGWGNKISDDGRPIYPPGQASDTIAEAS